MESVQTVSEFREFGDCGSLSGTQSSAKLPVASFEVEKLTDQSGLWKRIDRRPGVDLDVVESQRTEKKLSCQGGYDRSRPELMPGIISGFVPRRVHQTRGEARRATSPEERRPDCFEQLIAGVRQAKPPREDAVRLQT